MVWDEMSRPMHNPDEIPICTKITLLSDINKTKTNTNPNPKPTTGLGHML